MISGNRSLIRKMYGTVKNLLPENSHFGFGVVYGTCMISDKDKEDDEENSSSGSDDQKGRRMSTRTIQRHEFQKVKHEEWETKHMPEVIDRRFLDLTENWKNPNHHHFKPVWDSTLCFASGVETTPDNLNITTSFVLLYF